MNQQRQVTPGHSCRLEPLLYTGSWSHKWCVGYGTMAPDANGKWLERGVARGRRGGLQRSTKEEQTATVHLNLTRLSVCRRRRRKRRRRMTKRRRGTLRRRNEKTSNKQKDK